MPTSMELETPAPRLKHAKLVLLMVPLLSKHHRLPLQLLIANALPTFTVLVLFAQHALQTLSRPVEQLQTLDALALLTHTGTRGVEITPAFANLVLLVLLLFVTAL